MRLSLKPLLLNVNPFGFLSDLEDTIGHLLLVVDDDDDDDDAPEEDTLSVLFLVSEADDLADLLR